MMLDSPLKSFDPSAVIRKSRLPPAEQAQVLQMLTSLCQEADFIVDKHKQDQDILMHNP